MTIGELIAALSGLDPDGLVLIHEADPHFGTPRLHPCDGVVFLDNGNVAVSWLADLARQYTDRMSEMSERS
jgi:hypothetical protein